MTTGATLPNAITVDGDFCSEIKLRLSPGRVARGSVDRIDDADDRLTPPPAYAAVPLSTGAKTLASDDAAD
jgi:hypothetical protein